KRHPITSWSTVVLFGQSIGFIQGLHLADMNIESPEPPGRFGLRLAVYPLSQVLQSDRCLCHLTPASRVVRSVTHSRVPLLHGRYATSALLRTPPPPSPLGPTSRGLRLYGLPGSGALTPGGGGLLQLRGVSWSPCCRFHPAGVEDHVCQRTILHAAFTLTVAGSASGAPHFRGHFCVRLRCGPVTRRHPAMTLSMGFRSSVSLLPAI